MTKDVGVKIEGMLTDGDNQAVIVKASGEYYNRDGKHYIRYSEYIEEQKVATKNIIKMSHDHIDIIKKGSVDVSMTFEEGKSSQISYRTPYGTLLFDVETSSIQMEESKDQITAYIQYTLKADGNHISDNKVTLNISSK